MHNPILRSSAVLKINGCWQGLEYITPQDAFSRMFNGRSDDSVRPMEIILCDDGSISNESRVYTADAWMRLPVRTNHISIGLAHGRRVRVPLAVITPHYNILPKTLLSFSKRGLYTRDRGRCAYCDCVIPFDESTKDHIIPVSRKGATNWINCVLSCKPCNSKKGNRTPDEAGMVLLRRPRAPGQVPVMVEIRTNSPREHLALLAAA